MEKEESRFKKKRIVVVVLSMIMCMMLIGIAVYAATSQTLTVKNTVTINSSEQVRVDIGVSYAHGASDDARTLFNNSEAAVTAAKALTFTEIGKKASTEDAKELTGPDIVFSYENKYTYTVYKVVFDNTAASDITYNIAFQNAEKAAYTFNSQIVVYNGTSASTTLTEGTAISGDVLVGDSATLYIVVAMKTPLIDATPVATEVFNMVITANQKAGA